MKLPIYLDYMATTPVDPRVAKKMTECLTIDGNFGNPASTHFYGLQAKAAVENAREEVASLINAEPKAIIWTSGATESNNLAIKGAANFYKRKGKHIVTYKTEHKAVLDTCKYLANNGFEVTYLSPEKNGLLDLQKLESALRPDTILVSIMHANNEIGVIQDLAAIGELTRTRGIIFHVDAAQSAGKVPIDVNKLKIDLMSLASHKIYGPKGIGALYIRREPRLHLESQIHGGDQEYGIRAGTLATHQIVGMGEAFRLAKLEMQKEHEHILNLRNRFLNGLKTLDNIFINGDLEHRLAENLNISFVGIDSETLIAALKDLAVSSGSACNSATIEPSYVLSALGLKPELSQSAIRFSFGRFTTEAEIDYAVEHIISIVKKLRNH